MQRPRKNINGSHRASRTAVRRGATIAAALIGSAVLAAPAAAEVIDVRQGHNITAFHNGDFIAAFGYGVGEELTVDVYRGSHLIGTATGPTVDTDPAVVAPDDGALEVNHGPLGAPAPGDCWTGHTPDILPGDRVEVTNATGTDSIYIDDINISTGPTEVTAAVGSAQVGDVIMEGNASTAGLSPAPIALDVLAGETRYRDDATVFRAEPSRFERIAGTADGYRAIYAAPFNGIPGKDAPGSTPEQRKQFILNGFEHGIGYGHVAVLPLETQIADWPHGGGPALGCEGSPAQANAVATSTDPIINAARLAGATAAPIGFSGTAMADVDQVTVELNDTDDSTNPVTAETTVLTAAPSGEKAWTVQFTAEQVAALKDGTLTATGTYGGGAATGATMKVLKDTVAPGAVVATPAAGTYIGAQSVSLSAETGAEVRYTLDGSTPTKASALYGGQIRVTASQTIKAIAFDKAGNSGPMATLAYVIDAPALRTAPAIPAQPQGAGVPAIRAIPASISSLRSASSLRLATARRSGIAASFMSNGVASAELRLYSLKGGRKLVSSKRVGLADGAHSVRLSARTMRKRLASGRYLLEVSTAGKVIRTSIRIVA